MIDWEWLISVVIVGFVVGFLFGLWMGIDEGFTLCRVNEHRQRCEAEKGIFYRRDRDDEEEYWR